jgi:Holliday junction resolvase RusA-like endonuclease
MSDWPDLTTKAWLCCGEYWLSAMCRKCGKRRDGVSTPPLADKTPAMAVSVQPTASLKELRFSLDIVPPKSTAQGKGVCVVGGKPRFFTKAKQKRDIGFFTAALTPHIPPVPFEGPLQVNIEWHFPYRKSERKSIVKAGVPIPHDKIPDLDNLEKGFLDVMSRLNFWRDDGQIAWKQTRKLWSARPRIDVYIFDMEAS